MLTNNKYLGTSQEVINTGSPSVLANIRVEVPWLPPFMAEAQLYLDPFLSLKMSQHKTYEITRATKWTDLLDPVHKPVWDEELTSNEDLHTV